MWRCFLLRHLGSLTHALCSQTDYMRDVNCPENKYGWKRPSAVRHRWLLMLTHWGHWGESEYGLDGKFFSRNKNVWIGDIEVFESNLLANVRFTPDLSSKEVSVSQSKPLYCHPFVFFFLFFPVSGRLQRLGFFFQYRFTCFIIDQHQSPSTKTAAFLNSFSSSLHQDFKS